MQLFNRLYQTTFVNVDLSKIPNELQQECFLFNKSILNDAFGDFEYSVMNPYQLQEFISLQSKTGIEYDITDISEKVLMGEFVIDPQFAKPLGDFMESYETLEKTTDLVLEKIFKHGILKMNAVDKKILK